MIYSLNPIKLYHKFIEILPYDLSITLLMTIGRAQNRGYN